MVSSIGSQLIGRAVGDVLHRPDTSPGSVDLLHSTAA
jgi:hypothetical protein